MLDMVGLGTYQRTKAAPTHQAMRNQEIDRAGLPHVSIQASHQVRGAKFNFKYQYPVDSEKVSNGDLWLMTLF